MDNKMEKTASEILFEAARYLENEGKWGKNAFFKLSPPEESDGACVMCAHGAIAFCGNKDVKEAISNREGNKASRMVSDTKHGSPIRLAHDYAFQVGLDYWFNDMCAKTKEDVINKIREAGNLALKNETASQ
jgi:hypothetical protein